MGQAKRRGTFEQRKAQKLAKQYGLTNHELAEAYHMNKKYDLEFLLYSRPDRQLNNIDNIDNMINYYLR